MKPTLDLYIGRRVLDVARGGEDWQWVVILEGEVRIVNKSRNETMAPSREELIGTKLESISFSTRDTTITFLRAPHNFIKLGFNPTQYAILDPAYGGEAYPQWPEELEEAGIPSHPDEAVSADPSEEWVAHHQKLLSDQQSRIDRQAREFLAEEEKDG